MQQSSGHRYQVLDALRGICACMVVLFHFRTIGWISTSALVRDSWLFVDFFFVLSGFVITSAYRQRIAAGFPIGRFLWLRLGRIYPVHLVVTGLFLAIQLMLLAQGGRGHAFQGDMSVGGLLAGLTFTQTFLWSSGVTWNAPTWSIAVEMWTYLGFALMFRMLHTAKALVAAAAVVIILSGVDLAVVYGGDMNQVYGGAIVRCFYGFALGVIGAELYPVLRRRLSPHATLLEILALGGIAAFIVAVRFAPISLAASPLFLVVILIFAGERGAISLGLKTAVPLLLGELSYSIYMIHLFILYRFSGGLAHVVGTATRPFLICQGDVGCTASGPRWLADALIVPVLATVVGAAWLMRNYVEVPCERWAKNVVQGRARSHDTRDRQPGPRPASVS